MSPVLAGRFLTTRLPGKPHTPSLGIGIIFRGVCFIFLGSNNFMGRVVSQVKGKNMGGLPWWSSG